jgi:hypothetical protein
MTSFNNELIMINVRSASIFLLPLGLPYTLLSYSSRVNSYLLLLLMLDSLMLRNTVAPPSACKLSNLILKQQPHLINVLTIAKIASS